jgi:DNA-binding GntR family transcriptional regulator
LRGREKVYEVLRQRLVGGHYAPGTQLREEPLAQEFGLSRSPVRAALKRLVEDGLATADAGQGIHVAHWSEADIEETFQLRMLLEPYAASLVASHVDTALVVQLGGINRAMERAIARKDIDGIPPIQRANREFHHALLIAAKSPRLRSALETMIDMPIVMRSFFVATPDELHQSLRQHEDITHAIEAADPELARQTMLVHLRMSYLRFMRHRRKWPSER